jgi:alkanesulfonate monooxygenase SsuD/methylene tetrahydromethanopterin reductase-like flavin-dependent oxidoreductase (luciferase family)
VTGAGPAAPGKITLGAIPWTQFTTWADLREAGIRAEALGYDSLWAWDHLYPIVGSHHGPMFEGYLTLAGWAAVTERVRIGLLVGANPFRNPAVVGKMVTQLDHMTGGRMVCGMGAAWFEEEHEDFGLEFGASPGERLRWLEEAVVILRGMFDGTEPSGTARYTTRHVRNDPPPVQAHLPILVGGGGERRTLRIVARHADANNLGGGYERVRHKESVLLQHCADVGRDPAEIERTANLGVVVIRDTLEEARRPQRRSDLVAEPAHRDARICRRGAAEVHGNWLPASHRRLPRPGGHRIHGAARRRGPLRRRGRLRAAANLISISLG